MKRIFLYLETYISKKNIIKLLLAISMLEFIALASQTTPFVFWTGRESLEKYVTGVMAKCVSARDRGSCYDREIPKITGTLSLEDTFAVLREIQERDGSYWYCHVVSHNIAGEEVKKDPEKWKDVLTRCPVGMCSNGCTHGVFMERFQREFLEPAQLPLFEKELQGICEKRKNWNPTNLDRYACYHALGHLLMYVTSADTAKSVAMCNNLASEFLHSCYDGVFMQIFQPLEEEDKALVYNIKPSRDKLFTFCKSFGEASQASCWSEGWPLFFERINDPQKTTSFCRQLASEVQRVMCYSGMFSRMVSQFNLDLPSVANFCLKVPANLQGQCFGISASRIIDIDRRLVGKASELCVAAPSQQLSQACFHSILSAINFMFKRNTAEFQVACSILPPPWNKQCSL